jgi:hypothetical protein
MRTYPEIEEQILALLRTQPLSNSRYITRTLTEHGQFSTQAVGNTLKSLEFAGEIVNVGGETAAWRLPK